ncbi:MAG: murein biosynthesis integral membrane protein MurJ [Pseudomonadota bacterium]
MNLLKALAAISSMTLLSRITGFIREMLAARIFGAGLYTDAFFVAFRIPNLLRRLFAEGAFSQAFVPILSEYKTQQGFEATRLLIDHVATLLAVILFVVSAIGILAAPVIIYASAYGFTSDPQKFAVTVMLLKICFPYILFVSLTSLGAGILNTYSQFKVPAFTPVFLNLAMITATLFATPYFNPPILALAWGVFFGGILQLAFQVPFLLKLNLLPRFRPNFRDPGVWRILKLMGPSVFGVSIAQISLLINTFFASFLVTGSVSWLNYADRLMEFPSALLGVALGTILLPSLSKHYTNKSSDEYSKLLDWGLRLTMLLTLPAAAALAILSIPLVATLFKSGAFTATDVWMTRQALVAYSVGLTGIIMVKILAPGFYARQNVKTPVKIAVVTLITTQLLNVAFIPYLKHAGLALSIGMAASLNSGLLYHYLRKSGIYQPQPGWAAFILKVILALGAMAAVLWFAMGSEISWLSGTLFSRALRLAWIMALGAGTYFIGLWLLGFRLRDFSQRGAS